MFNLFPRIKPIQLRHCDIQYYDLRLQFGRKLQKCSTVIHNSDNLKLGLEQILAGFCQQSVVVGDEQPSSMAWFHDAFRLQELCFRLADRSAKWALLWMILTAIVKPR
jgi:hypothetical protein